MSGITGLHHVTAIAGDAQENVDFYAGVLGMRLVKRSVNQDVPDTYHLFYADAEGHPGADLTFFPWPSMGPARRGTGLGSEVALAVPAGTLGYWEERLARHGIATGTAEFRRGERALPLRDPHGLDLALVETGDEREFTPWTGSTVPVDRQILGLHSVRLLEQELERPVRFLIDVLGFADMGSEDGWRRLGIDGGGSGRFLETRELPGVPRGAWGTGSVHHVAWRVPDDRTELDVRERVAAARRRPTPVIDRFWFRSVYFLEPGGVLMEIATDGPGFTVDEPAAALGERLVLPPWLEPERTAIEAALPRITLPAHAEPAR